MLGQDDMSWTVLCLNPKGLLKCHGVMIFHGVIEFVQYTIFKSELYYVLLSRGRPTQNSNQNHKEKTNNRQILGDSKLASHRKTSNVGVLFKKAGFFKFNGCFENQWTVFWKSRLMKKPRLGFQSIKRDFV